MADNQHIDSGGDAFSKTLESILSNPDMLSMVSSMAEQLKSGGAISAVPTEVGTAEVSEPQEASSNDTFGPESVQASAAVSKLSSLAPLLSGLGGASPTNSRRDCLLHALEPYLSDGRREAIETIIKISKISDVLRHLN